MNIQSAFKERIEEAKQETSIERTISMIQDNPIMETPVFVLGLMIEKLANKQEIFEKLKLINVNLIEILENVFDSGNKIIQEYEEREK